MIQEDKRSWTVVNNQDQTPWTFTNPGPANKPFSAVKMPKCGRLICKAPTASRSALSMIDWHPNSSLQSSMKAVGN